MSDVKMKHISVGKDGNVWAASETDGTIHRVIGDGAYVGWMPDKSGKANVIAAVSFGEAWCVNKDHEIWHVVKADVGEGQWTKIPTQSGRADAKTISVGADGTVWYAQTDDKLFRRDGNGWRADPSGKATVIAAASKDEIWGVNGAHEIWHLKSGQWAKFVETGPNGKPWAYTVKQGDGLYAIVRQQFGVADQKEVERIAGLIVAENHIKNKDRIDAGTVLKLSSH